MSTDVTSEAGDIDVTAFNPFDPATMQCPFPHYAAMREQAPVNFVESLGMYFVTRHDLVLGILRDPQTYSSEFGVSGVASQQMDERLAEVFREGYPRVSTMLTADMPEHTRYRRLVSKAFTPKVVAELEPAIRATAVELADGLVAAAADGATLEFVERFAIPLPVAVIARALNVPDDRLADFKRWSDDAIAGIGTNISIEERIEAERGVNDFQRYFAAEFERRLDEPQDDLLTALVNARIDDDDDEVADKRPLDMAEMLSIVQQLLVAGNETTTKMLTEMMRLLGERPDEWAKVRSDTERVPAVIEETLRMATPTQGMFRISTRDHELEGVAIPKGATIVIVFASANRDGDLYPAGDDFDPDREHLRDHLAFGKGIHFCLGANLSRLEGRVALEELSSRFESFTLADDNDYAYHPSFLLRGLKRLDLDLVAAD